MEEKNQEKIQALEASISTMREQNKLARAEIERLQTAIKDHQLHGMFFRIGSSLLSENNFISGLICSSLLVLLISRGGREKPEDPRSRSLDFDDAGTVHVGSRRD